MIKHFLFDFLVIFIHVNYQAHLSSFHY